MKFGALSSRLYPSFDAGFYLDANPDVRAAGVDPYEHYVRRGKSEGRAGHLPLHVFPLRICDVRQLAESDSSTRCHQLQWGVLPSAAKGERQPPRLFPGFDDEFYLRNNPDVRAAGVDPYDHYVRTGRSEGRPANPPRVISPLLVNYGRRHLETSLDGVCHQPLWEPLRRPAKVTAEDDRSYADFDEQFYLENNPDVRETGVAPYAHYVETGKAEGRQGRRLNTAYRDPDRLMDASKKSVLLVLNSKPGASEEEYAFALVRAMSGPFNVVVLLLGDEEAPTAIQEAAAAVVGPVSINGFPRQADRVVTALCGTFSPDFALVSGLEARIVIKRLTELMIPTVTMVHECVHDAPFEEALRFVMRWSMEVVFSSTSLRKRVFVRFPKWADGFSHLLPPKPVVASADESEPGADQADRQEISSSDESWSDLGKDDGERPIVVLGVGNDQDMHGIDLFLDTAAGIVASAGSERCRFVWVGDGKTVRGESTCIYLTDGAASRSLRGRLSFIGSEAVNDADIAVLTAGRKSLADLVNQLLDNRIPVLCFERSAEIGEALAESSPFSHDVVADLDVRTMADEVMNLVRSHASKNSLSAHRRKPPQQYFALDQYCSRIVEIARKAKRRLAAETQSAERVVASGLVGSDFMAYDFPDDPSLDHRLLHGYVRSWSNEHGREESSSELLAHLASIRDDNRDLAGRTAR